MHETLEQFLVEVLHDSTDGRAPAEWTVGHRTRLRALAEEACSRYEERGLTGRPIFWKRDRGRILRDIDQFLQKDQEQRSARFGGVRAVAAELGFGFGDERDPSAGSAEPDESARTGPTVAFVLEDGRTLAMRGRVDRVDRADDGSLVVLDYKTGSATGYRDAAAETPATRGTSLQLPVYGAAARAMFGAPDTPVHAAYWFISSIKGRWEWIGYDITDDVDKHMAVALTAITTGIESGVFAARPNPNPPYTYVDCVFCNPDGLGTGDRRREWERKRNDPALRAYAAFSEPEAADEERGR